jgi:hypothetical protein
VQSTCIATGVGGPPPSVCGLPTRSDEMFQTYDSLLASSSVVQVEFILVVLYSGDINFEND